MDYASILTPTERKKMSLQKGEQKKCFRCGKKFYLPRTQTETYTYKKKHPVLMAEQNTSVRGAVTERRRRGKMQYSKEELGKILEDHKHWLEEDCENWETMKADLRSANLHNANLYGADLRNADLSDADLRNADLSDADLSNADLYNADLCDANLRGANLHNANLYGADLRDANNIPFIPYACPDTGSFIGYKKAKGLIVELEILSDAKRCSATGRKCRCDKAKVLSIKNLDGTDPKVEQVCSNRDENFIYKVGEIVEEPKFCEDRWDECSEGIHFSINRQEAVDYNN